MYPFTNHQVQHPLADGGLGNYCCIQLFGKPDTTNESFVLFVSFRYAKGLTAKYSSSSIANNSILLKTDLP